LCIEVHTARLDNPVARADQRNGVLIVKPDTRFSAGEGDVLELNTIETRICPHPDAKSQARRIASVSARTMELVDHGSCPSPISHTGRNEAKISLL
jgi:hypothetical protein